MGRLGWPSYGYKDLSAAIEDAEKVIAKIKTNKYTKEDLIRLVNANAAIMNFILDKAFNDKHIN